MDEPVNALDFIEKLKKENGKPVQGFSKVSGYLGFKAREKGIPVAGQFELTPLCNFSCKMCYVHLNQNQLNGRSVLSVETWKNLMHQAWKAGMLSATLTGGECLAYPGFEELFLFLHSLGCEASVLTNGSLLDEERIHFFRKHKPAKISVTLYGSNDDVYERVTGQRAFGKVIENVKRAVDADLPVSVSITPNTFLGEDVLETVRVAHEICKAVTVNSCIFNPREETGRSKQQDDPENELYLKIYRLLNELDGVETKRIDEEKLPPAGGTCPEDVGRGLRCGGGRSGFVMNWKGVLMPCNRMEMIQGDALKDGFSKAWAKVNREANNWPRVPECEVCAYKDVCHDCAANQLRFAEAGKIPTKLCEQTRFFVRNGVTLIPECE